MNMEEKLIAEQIVQKIYDYLNTGKNLQLKRNLFIYAEREYGGRTLNDIGHQYGVSQERVRQVHAKMQRVLNGPTLRRLINVGEIYNYKKI